MNLRPLPKGVIVEVSDLDHPRGVKKSQKIPPKAGSRPAWFLVLLFGHDPILAGGFYDQDSTPLKKKKDYCLGDTQKIQLLQ